ncbi:MAG: URC4/urg3 family protein [Pseudomonadota bacterium]
MRLTTTDQDREAARDLLSARAVRDRCTRVLAARTSLHHFRVNVDKLEAVADYVIETMRLNYPDLDIPFHARWRHFVIDGCDRWAALRGTLGVDLDGDEVARIQFDLAITSVLLDAGAGDQWRYRDQKTGRDIARSEGLALASLEAFAAGLFSSDRSQSLRADARALQTLDAERLGEAFQVTAVNPLVGLDGRVSLMRALGKVLEQTPDVFASAGPARVGGLFDYIRSRHGDQVEAADVLGIVLRSLGGIWPGRTEIGGVQLGDTWPHSAVQTDDATDGLVPLHKLSQWLTYSLIEPLQNAGVAVQNIDGLTGLAEYRNGGLFVDLGVLELKDPSAGERAHAPGDELIVEWRALTVALLDAMAVIIRDKLGRSAEDLPLASILEGGTWSAGRRIARELRPDGPPPIKIQSDGSVF